MLIHQQFDKKLFTAGCQWLGSLVASLKNGKCGKWRDGEIVVLAASSAVCEERGIWGCSCDLGCHGTWMCLFRQYLLMMEMYESISCHVLIMAMGVITVKQMEQVEAK